MASRSEEANDLNRPDFGGDIDTLICGNKIEGKKYHKIMSLRTMMFKNSSFPINPS